MFCIFIINVYFEIICNFQCNNYTTYGITPECQYNKEQWPSGALWNLLRRSIPLLHILPVYVEKEK